MKDSLPESVICVDTLAWIKAKKSLCGINVPKKLNELWMNSEMPIFLLVYDEYFIDKSPLRERKLVISLRFSGCKYVRHTYASKNLVLQFVYSASNGS